MRSMIKTMMYLKAVISSSRVFFMMEKKKNTHTIMTDIKGKWAGTRWQTQKKSGGHNKNDHNNPCGGYYQSAKYSTVCTNDETQSNNRETTWQDIVAQLTTLVINTYCDTLA